MRLTLVGNLPEDRQESMQRFTAMLSQGLRERDHAVTVLAPTLRFGRLAGSYRYAGGPKYLGYLDKFVVFPRQLRAHLRKEKPDVVHITDHANAVLAPAIAREPGVPVLATCHDLLQIRAARGEFAQHRPRGHLGRGYQRWILRHLSRVPHVACISEKTRADFLRLTSAAPDRVHHIPNALNHPYRPLTGAEARARLGPLLPHFPHGYQLHEGGAHWYKNRPAAVAMHAELVRRHPEPPSLVMVGPPFTDEEAARVATLPHLDRIVTLSNVTNDQLEALYALAEGLLFPSWEEGFGWPIAEAQACGCPVFTTNRAPMVEVGGLAAVYFDPDDPASAADTIVAAWPQRGQLRARGREHARNWRPERMLADYESLYRSLRP